MSKIIAVLGSESHTTSRFWAKLSINDKPVTFRDAVSKEWQTNFGDKHAAWCECVFAVKDGDIVTFEAGSNTGNRGANRDRTNITLRFDSSVEVADIPVAAGKLTGRLVEICDKNADETAAHESAKSDL